MLDLDDDRLLTLRTHSAGRGHTAIVYDDDGISTAAELRGEYFELHATTAFDESAAMGAGGGAVRTTMTLSLTVHHAGFTPKFTMVRWEVATQSGAAAAAAAAGASTKARTWTSVVCNGEVLQLVEDVAEVASGWSVQGGLRPVTTVALPLALAGAGGGVSCVAQ